MERTEYEPGNGTRYDLIYGMTPHRSPGPDSKQFMLIWMKRGGSGGVAVAVGNRVHPSYVAEKMGVGSEDARVLAEFINERTGWK
jgi:hypothetical protein|tara:strand:- start:1106 stop:1360 length:255 start_codon:yes stop_codon:yes gene_type:complete